MKHTLYSFFLIGLLVSCIGKSPKSKRAEKQASLDNSELTVQVDYQKMDFAQERPVKELAQLMEQEKNIRLDNIDIKKSGTSIYTFRQQLGDLSIHRKHPSRYSILEHYILPIGSVYGKVALVRFYFNPYTGELERDWDFEPELSVYDYWSNHVVKEYDSYLENRAYTNPNIEEVPHQAYVALRYLMFNLTLASILEDCAPCRERMQRLVEDFPFVEKEPYYQQNLYVCQAILARFDKETN